MRNFWLAVMLALGVVGANAQTTHMACTRSEQVGCLELDLLNARFDPSNPLHAGLDKPAATEDERYRRVTTLGMATYKDMKAGKTQPSVARSWLVFMWNVDETVPLANLAAYMQVGTTKLGTRKVPLVVVTESSWPEFDPVSGLGKPARVFRVGVEPVGAGERAVGAAIQFPWTMVTDQTYILVCPEDRDTVYPNRETAKQGHGFTSAYLGYARKEGWEYILTPFFSKD